MAPTCRRWTSGQSASCSFSPLPGGCHEGGSIRQAPAQAPTTWRVPKVPQQAGDVIVKAPDKDYEQGFPTAPYFIQALEGAMGKSGSTTVKREAKALNSRQCTPTWCVVSRVLRRWPRLCVAAQINCTLLTAAITDEHSAPQLFFPVPEKSKGGMFSKLGRPKTWFNKVIRIHFQAHGLHIVPCAGLRATEGELLQRKGWVKDWAPVLLASFATNRVALSVGRVVGVPPPGSRFRPVTEIELSPDMLHAVEVAQKQLEGVEQMLGDVKESVGGALPRDLVDATESVVAGGKPGRWNSTSAGASAGAAYRAFRGFRATRTQCCSTQAREGGARPAARCSSC